MFANFTQVNRPQRPETAGALMGTMAKVALGDYARGGKSRTDANGQ